MELKKPAAGVFTQPFNHLFRIQGHRPSKYHFYDIPPTGPAATQDTTLTRQILPDAGQQKSLLE